MSNQHWLQVELKFFPESEARAVDFTTGTGNEIRRTLRKPTVSTKPNKADRYSFNLAAELRE